MMVQAKHTRSASSHSYDHLTPLLDEMHALDEADPRRTELRDHLVTEFMPVAEHVARRYRGKGISRDDLIQVAAVGLINAIDRFDSHRGTEFLSFAIPTVTGEVRRYFRDSSWGLHVPRRVKELHSQVNRAESELTHELSRPALFLEVAEHLDVSKKDVRDAVNARHAYRAESLDESPPGGKSETRAQNIGGRDKALDHVEEHESLMPLLDELPLRERRILDMRYSKEWTQGEIAHEIGVSQMQVSRILNQTLTNLRENLVDIGPE